MFLLYLGAIVISLLMINAPLSASCGRVLSNLCNGYTVGIECITMLQMNPIPQPPQVHYNYHVKSSFPKYSPATFLPSLPGKRPGCARPGSTVCENIDKYPQDLIFQLASKTQFNFESLFIRDLPKSKKPNRHRTKPSSTSFNYNASFNTNMGSGYAASQHPFDVSNIQIVDPDLYNSYSNMNNGWWKRSDGYNNNETFHNGRYKRQSSRVSASQVAGFDLCPTRTRFMEPRAAMNINGEWRYVVNVKNYSTEYIQQVSSEVCLTKECDGLCILPDGYTSECKQKYVKMKLVALHDSGDKLYQDNFWLAHCCVCHIVEKVQ